MRASPPAPEQRFIYYNIMTKQWGWQSQAQAALREPLVEFPIAAQARVAATASNARVVSFIHAPLNPEGRRQLVLGLACYTDRMRLAIRLFTTPEMIPEATVTVNVPDADLPPGYIAVQADDVYAPLLQALLHEQLVAHTELLAPSGFRLYPVLRTWLRVPRLPEDDTL